MQNMPAAYLRAVGSAIPGVVVSKGLGKDSRFKEEV